MQASKVDIDLSDDSDEFAVEPEVGIDHGLHAAHQSSRKKEMLTKTDE